MKLVLNFAVGLPLMGALLSNVHSETQSVHPRDKNLDELVQAIWWKTRSKYGESAMTLCVSMPAYLNPDSSSRASKPLAWHVDFLPDATPKTDAVGRLRQAHLRQLDALAKVGVLSKTKETATINEEQRTVARYRLTEKGWAASRYQEYGKRSDCFTYGVQRYFGIDKVEPRGVTRDGRDLYLVVPKVGVRSESELVDWARDPDLQAAFPEIKRNIEGTSSGLFMVLERGEWIDNQGILGNDDFKRITRNPNQDISTMFFRSSEARSWTIEQSKLPPPEHNEVRNLLLEAHSNQYIPVCLDLPGASGIPVDRDLFTGKPGSYLVAIFKHKQRSRHDQVASKTIPYLNLLEQLGVLKKRAVTGVSGRGKDAGSVFDADVYEVTPTFQQATEACRWRGLPLGPPSIEIVDLQVAEKDESGLPISSIRYKLKRLFTNPPRWANDPFLKVGWHEMKEALDRGMACEGELAFNRKTRKLYGESGTCWWAFDSIYN